MHRRSLLKSIATIAASTGLVAASKANEQSNGSLLTPAGKKPQAKQFIEAADGTNLFFRDWGAGAPIVFLSSLGSSSLQWQYNTVPLSSHGFRCIAYDRRSHGRSSDPGRGYGYDTLAGDLAAVLDQLDLRGVTLVTHSMSGGEAVRYLTLYGSSRVARLVLVAPTLPYILKTPDNPGGIDRSAIDALRALWYTDYPKWVTDNMRPIFTPETSDAMVQWGVGLLIDTSLKAILDCHHSVTDTDFRAELPRIKVPTLIVHGDKDVNAQIDFTGRRTAKLIPRCVFKVYEGAAHGLFITHADRFNKDLTTFVTT
jgi:non-heme chloroperoxidase